MHLAFIWLENHTNIYENFKSICLTNKILKKSNNKIPIFFFLFSGYFPLQSEHCLTWICLDVLFCTASIMHLCTISVDRYLSLRYPMRFGRNKTRKRVTVKIIFVWLLSIAMSLPLSLMYSKVSEIIYIFSRGFFVFVVLWLQYWIYLGWKTVNT